MLRLTILFLCVSLIAESVNAQTELQNAVETFMRERKGVVQPERIMLLGKPLSGKILRKSLIDEHPSDVALGRNESTRVLKLTHISFEKSRLVLCNEKGGRRTRRDTAFYSERLPSEAELCSIENVRDIELFLGKEDHCSFYYGVSNLSSVEYWSRVWIRWTLKDDEAIYFMLAAKTLANSDDLVTLDVDYGTLSALKENAKSLKRIATESPPSGPEK